MLQTILNRLPLKGRERLTRPFLKQLGEVDARCYGYRMKLDLHDYIQRCLYLNCFERADQDQCLEILKSGDKVVDIGANCGGYLALFARCVGSQGRVIGFEPNPKLKWKLDYFTRENDVPQIDLRFVGLSDIEGELNLWTPPPGNENEDATMCEIEGWSAVTVPVRTLDEQLEGYPNRSFKLLKIDVEGMEHRILSGGQASLSRGLFENLLVEFNSHWLEQQGSSCAELFEFVSSTGYASSTPNPVFVQGGLLNLWFTRAK